MVCGKFLLDLDFGIGNENSNKIINHPDFSLQLLSMDAKTIEDD